MEGRKLQAMAKPDDQDKRDEPVKIPAEFEEALRALLKVDPKSEPAADEADEDDEDQPESGD
jgi:hypothetical protein